MEWYEQEFLTHRQMHLEAKKSYYASAATKYIAPFQIADRLWYVGDKAVCVYLIETDEGLILLDSGYPNAAHLVVDSIWRAGFDPKNVKWILHSHLHFDHFGLSTEFQRLYGTKLAISAADAAAMREMPYRTSLDCSHTPFLENPVYDRELEDGEIFEFGGVKIRCVLVPGHTLGTMSFLFDVTADGKTHRAGLSSGGGAAALSLHYMLTMKLPLDMPQRLIEALDRCEKETVTLALSAHPAGNRILEKREQQLREGGNPFLDNGQSWQHRLDKERAFARKMIAENEETARLHNISLK